MLAVQQERAKQLAETEKNIKEILARRGEGEYDPNQQVVSFDGFTPAAENKNIDKMTKEELITLSKRHIKGCRNMKKGELLTALKAFMVANPGKILLGTESALVEEDNEDNANAADADADFGEKDNEDNDDVQSPPVMNSFEHACPEIPTTKSCSVQECEGASIEDLVMCDLCELWFCKDLHGPHSSHSAQTHYKVGRIRKKAEDMLVDDSTVSAGGDVSSSNMPPLIIEQPSQQLADVTGVKRRISELDELQQPAASSYHDMVKVRVALAKVRDILSKPSKNQNELLRSTLNFTSYDVTFLTMLAKELGLDISSVANKSRVSRLQVLDYLLSILN
jgi:hypothetical protein